MQASSFIQPDPKSTPMKIKMVAANYLPAIEFGRRRRRVKDDVDAMELSTEDLDRLRRERRRTRGAVREEDEAMSEGLIPGENGETDSRACELMASTLFSWQ